MHRGFSQPDSFASPWFAPRFVRCMDEATRVDLLTEYTPADECLFCGKPFEALFHGACPQCDASSPKPIPESECVFCEASLVNGACPVCDVDEDTPSLLLSSAAHVVSDGIMIKKYSQKAKIGGGNVQGLATPCFPYYLNN